MKKLDLKNLRRQAGVTILEFVAFIGLAALVIAGALGLYGGANSSANSAQYVEGVQGIVMQLKGVAAGHNAKDTITLNSISRPTGWSAGANNNTWTHDRTQANVVLTAAANTFSLAFNNPNNTQSAIEAKNAIAGKSVGGVTATSAAATGMAW